jgi:type III restriction enzyme
MLHLKEYQQRSLDVLSEYMRVACQHGSDNAFYMMTKRAYHPVPQLEGMPYVCLRVPTGGGKTLMAGHAVGMAARDFLHADQVVCLWLVPSNAILEQTLLALKTLNHPYRESLNSYFQGNVRVLNLQEALEVQRPVIDSRTVVIVSTLAALRVQDIEGRKVYESREELVGHFEGIPAHVSYCLEANNSGQVVYSLANVLRLRRPIIIMDEAHNARTKLSFDTLTRFNPSCVIEFTATPVTTHKPENGYFASNVLTHVSARELKEAEMIKLPIKLRTRGDWKEVIGDAIAKQRELEGIAAQEARATGEYIRPIVLLQAQQASKERQTLTVDVVKQTLLDEFQIPAEQVAIATGDTREIDGVNLFEASCPIRFIITQQALKEGWDCSFAYIFCSVAEQHSARAVEQLLGRVLRMPRANRKQHEELNCAYAYAASPNFIATAQSLQDALVESGFQRMEASDLVTPEDVQPTLPALGGLFAPVKEVVYETPDLSGLASIIRDKIDFDPQTNTLSVQAAMTETDKAALQDCFTRDEDKATVERLYHRSRGVTPASVTPVSEREPFHIPMLGIRVDGVLELFDDSHFLDLPWQIADCDVTLTESEFPSRVTAGAAGEIDVSQSGALAVTNFVNDLHEQLSLITAEPGWTVGKLATWLDQQVPHPDIVQSQSSLFIYNVVNHLVESRGIPVEQLARFKYRLRNAVDAKIGQHRTAFRKRAYTQSLFGPEPAALEVTPECQCVFTEDRYAPNWYYEGGMRLEKHYFRLIGELKSTGEEFECAAFLNSLPQVKYWVRNIERRPQSSFWLPTSTDYFYPDFIVMLQDGRYLVVEYKGEHLWSNDDSKEKRAVGELWAARSNGQCVFVMPNGKNWGAIQRLVAG